MSPPVPALDSRARRFARLANLILWSESLLAAFWRPLTLIGAFVALALFDVPPSLPPVLHAALLLAFIVALAALIVVGKRGLRPPATEAALRRVERDSGLAHRPFATLTDRPAEDADPGGRGLWRLHLARRRADVRRLRLSLPRPGLSERDPRALRVGVAILLVLGFVVAGDRAGSLIAQSFEPRLSFAGDSTPIDAWIRPPAYTGLSPILLKAGEDKPIAVPTGSTIEVHVTGGGGAPRLVFGDERQDFAKIEGNGFSLSHVLSSAGTLRIRRGWGTLAKWRIVIVPDLPPSIAFAHPPEATHSGTLRIDYDAGDDYGVAAVALQVRIVPSARHIVADPIAATLTSEQNEKDLKGTSFQDLTSHPWAGMKVLAKLVATDTAGQTGESVEIPITLPERIFTQPIPRTLIAARKQVIMNSAPWRRLGGQIAAIAYQPELYGGDIAIFLALRTAASELNEAQPDDDRAVADIEDLLWNAAVHIEDGDRSDAEKALRTAEEALEKALKSQNTSASEIEQLTKNLQAAMDRYLDALAKNLQQRLAQGQQGPTDKQPDNSAVDRNDLSNMVDQMNEMAKGGARQSAESMLSNLKNMLENMQAQANPGMNAEKGEQTLKELKDLAQRQREMMQGDSKGPGAAKDQEALRQALGDAMRDLDDATGKIPESLAGAERSMRDAARSLQQGNGATAKEQQAGAAGQLDQAIQGLSDQLSEQGEGSRPGDSDGKGSRDPFGRGRVDTGQNVKVPTARQMTRSLEILDELRRRAGEHERPRLELDYIQRLLEQF